MEHSSPPSDVQNRYLGPLNNMMYAALVATRLPAFKALDRNKLLEREAALDVGEALDARLGNTKPVAWTDVLIAIRPGGDYADFKCPSQLCDFSADSENSVVNHCLGSKSKPACPETELFVRLYLKHHKDLQKKVNATLAVNPDKVKQAKALEAAVMAALGTLPLVCDEVRGLAKKFAQHYVTLDPEIEAASSPMTWEDIEEMAGFSYEDLVKVYGM